MPSSDETVQVSREAWDEAGEIAEAAVRGYLRPDEPEWEYHAGMMDRATAAVKRVLDKHRALLTPPPGDWAWNAAARWTEDPRYPWPNEETQRLASHFRAAAEKHYVPLLDEAHKEIRRLIWQASEWEPKLPDAREIAEAVERLEADYSAFPTPTYRDGKQQQKDIRTVLDALRAERKAALEEAADDILRRCDGRDDHWAAGMDDAAELLRARARAAAPKHDAREIAEAAVSAYLNGNTATDAVQRVLDKIKAGEKGSAIGDEAVAVEKSDRSNAPPSPAPSRAAEIVDVSFRAADMVVTPGASEAWKANARVCLTRRIAEALRAARKAALEELREYAELTADRGTVEVIDDWIAVQDAGGWGARARED